MRRISPKESVLLQFLTNSDVVMVLSRVLVLLACLAIVNCEVNKSLLKSIISHLEEENYLAENFSSNINDNALRNEKFNQTSIENLRRIFEKDVASKLEDGDDGDCIMENFRNYKVFNIFLKGLTFSSIKKSRNVRNFASESSFTTRDLITTLRKVCDKQEYFGKKFDAILKANQKEIPNYNKSVLKCLVKFYVEKEALDAQKFGLEYKDAENCEAIEKNLNDVLSRDPAGGKNQTFYGLSAVSVENCANKKYENEKILLKTTSFDLITKFTLDNNMMRILKEDYIEVMTNQIKFLMECLGEMKKL